MSVTSSIGSASAANYATTLAQTSQLNLALNKIGSAIQGGNLNTAKAALAALIRAHPEYAATASNNDASDDSTSTDPVNQDFQNVASALDGNDANAAKQAWAQLTTDLGKDGVTITDPKVATAKVLAQTKENLDSQLLNSIFGSGTADSSSLASLLGTDSNTTNDSLNSALSNWLTYQADGTANSAASVTPTFTNLNTTA